MLHQIVHGRKGASYKRAVSIHGVKICVVCIRERRFPDGKAFVGMSPIFNSTVICFGNPTLPLASGAIGTEVSFFRMQARQPGGHLAIAVNFRPRFLLGGDNYEGYAYHVRRFSERAEFLVSAGCRLLGIGKLGQA